MADGVTLDLEFLYENIIGRCKRCSLLTHIGLPCNGTELPPIVKVAQKLPAYKPLQPPALLLAMAAAVAPERPRQPCATAPPQPNYSLPSLAITAGNNVALPMLDPPPTLEIVVQDPSSSTAHKKRSVKIIRREPPPKSTEKRSLDKMNIDGVNPTLKKYKPTLAVGTNLSVPPFELPDDLTLGNLFYTRQKKKPGRPRGSGNKNKLGVSGHQLKKSPKKKSQQKQATEKINSPEKEDPAPETSAPSNGNEASA